ncbi:MAG TPA: metalloregulator ArsR/SmtB family transcription factor [Longimicrobiales bacterium]|nr:metalloregulator ArsR/SmtB family transcription factor [Longimicrobiales bacterium]
MAKKLTPALIEVIAERFRALGEPTRLHILNTLRRGEHTVSELAMATGLSQANLSKHLQVLLAQGFLSRRKEGLFAYYSLADSSVFELCDLMCARLETEAAARRQVLGRR